MNKTLILVDLENQWSDKDSDYFVGDISEIIEKTNELIDFCRKENYKIIFIRHVEKDSDKVITKYKISSFYKTNLEKELEGIKEIVICGILTNLCVRSLIEEAYDREFNIIVIKDCCVAFNKETQEFTFKDLKSTREEIEFLNLIEFIR